MLRSLWAGVLQTGIVVAGVLAFGLGWAGVASLVQVPASAATAGCRNEGATQLFPASPQARVRWRAASGASEGTSHTLPPP